MSEAMIPEKGPTIPDFFMDTVENTFRTQQEGRPCFDEVESVRLWIPGDRHNSPVQRVNDDIRQRWPKQYEAFKAGLEPPLDGTPLTEWPPIKKTQAMEFAYFHIKTVEQLAGVNDAQLQNLPMGSRELREQAKAYVDIAQNGTGPIAKMVAENMALRDEIALKDRTIVDLNSRLKDMESAANARAAA